MPVNTVHTNMGAMIALQGLNKTNELLDRVTKRVNTGYRVNDSFDDGAGFAVAQGLRADIKGLEAVTEQLQSAKGLISVANSAATSISDAMARLKGVIVKLADNNLSTDQRSKYETDYNNIKSEIDGYVTNATFNGQNLINTTTAVKVISNLAGDALSIGAYNLATSVANKVGTAPTTAAAAQALITTTGTYTVAFNVVGDAMASFGSINRRVDNQISYLKSVSDATEVGLGAIVDADLAKESARLQSLQIRQQLATQTLQIANQSPSIILSLFRGG